MTDSKESSAASESIGTALPDDGLFQQRRSNYLEVIEELRSMAERIHRGGGEAAIERQVVLDYLRSRIMIMSEDIPVSRKP